MVTAPYRYCFKLFDFFRSCKILFGLVKFKTAPDRMSGNVWEVFVNTAFANMAKSYTFQSYMNGNRDCNTFIPWSNMQNILFSYL